MSRRCRWLRLARGKCQVQVSMLPEKGVGQADQCQYVRQHQSAAETRKNYKNKQLWWSFGYGCLQICEKYSTCTCAGLDFKYAKFVKLLWLCNCQISLSRPLCVFVMMMPMSVFIEWHLRVGRANFIDWCLISPSSLVCYFILTQLCSKLAGQGTP